MNTNTVTTVLVPRVRKVKGKTVPPAPASTSAPAPASAPTPDSKALERGIKVRTAVIAGAKVVSFNVTTGAKVAASGVKAVGNFFKGLVKGA